MTEVVLYATGSPIIVDVEESIYRANLSLRAGIRNYAGPCYLSDSSIGIDVSQIDDTLAQLPFIVPLFGPANRRNAVFEARQNGFSKALTLIDPSVVVPRSLQLDEGVYIGVGSTVGAASHFGSFTFVNRSTTIGHHFTCGDFVSIGPGVVIAGGVSIGTGAMVGAGAVILPQIQIGAHAVVGAGAIVTKTVLDGYTVAGHPARTIRTDSKGFDEIA